MDLDGAKQGKAFELAITFTRPDLQTGLAERI